MAKWHDVARDSLLACKILLAQHRHRSAVSRAYFAAYAALAGELLPVMGARFRFSDNNPSHGQLPSLILHHLPHRRFTESKRRNMRTALSNLWKARIQADYVPRVSVSESDARLAVKEACFLFQALSLEEFHA